MELSSEEKFDRAMKLSQRTGVSLEDAKAALNACDFDMLDAVVYLEQLGKTGAPKYSSYTTEQNTGAERTAAYDEVEVKVKRVTFGDLLAKFFKWVGKVIKIGNENFFDVTRNGEEIIKMPITVCVLLLLLAFWVCVPLLIIGLFFSFRYGFSGPVFRRDDVFNKAMDKASDVTENIKKEFNE